MTINIKSVHNKQNIALCCYSGILSKLTKNIFFILKVLRNSSSDFIKKND